ncbi:MAG: tetratricopeptide repeat protein [Tannerellaceae bacterium]|jgi:tetratricopeptide (TPR) repeat protein|nr:tetratricopeptide repeat protein [Tannerellaceae bacterium]
MKQDDISILLQRYLAACKRGAEVYFDADEIDAILDSFEEKEDFTHYESLLALGLRLHPDNPALKIRQCKYYLFNEEYAKALDCLDNLHDVNQEDVDLLRLECFCALKQYDKAIEYMDTLLKTKCEYVEDLFEFLVPLLGDVDMMDEAKELIERGKRIFPNNQALQEELCYILEAEGNFEQAIQICNELIDKEPYSYDYWFLLGRLYSQTNDFDNAIDAFDFALTCDDSDDELKVLKAYCFFMNENYEKAIEIYSELSAEEASSGRINVLMAECYIKLDNFELAYVLLKEIINSQEEEDPDIEADEMIYISFIRCCVETDRGVEASQALSKAAELFPDNVRILSLLALNYLENGKEELALRITRKILQLLGTSRNENEDEEFSKLISNDDKTLFAKENLDRVIRYYKKILQLNPHLSFKNRHIPPEELTKEYLNGKHNCN